MFGKKYKEGMTWLWIALMLLLVLLKVLMTKFNVEYDFFWLTMIFAFGAIVMFNQKENYRLQNNNLLKAVEDGLKYKQEKIKRKGEKDAK